MDKNKLPAYLSVFIFSFLFWELLVWSVDIREIYLGVIVAAAVSAFSTKFLIQSRPFYLYNPVRILWILVYSIGIFFVEVVKANIAMARIVLSKDMGGTKTGIIRVPGSKKIKSGYGLAMVANSITLTPGTITMDVAEDDKGGNYYYIHWIDVATTDRQKAGEMIKGRLEKGVGRIWE